MYLEQLKKLIELQDIDNKLIEYKQKIEEIPKMLDILQSDIEELLAKKEELTEKINIIEKNKKNLELEIQENAAKIKTVKNKIMMISKSREYQAMMKELDNFERINRNKEEDLALILEDLSLLKKDFDEVVAQIEEKQSKMDELKKKAENELQTLQAKIKDLEQARDNAYHSIPTPILSRYNFIKERLNQPVVVPVRDGICMGCCISITPQVYVELQKGEQILNCPNCQRLIYWEEFYKIEEKN